MRAEQEKRLARAGRDLARLGRVNPLALEEHAALEQRHQFLAAQLADLKASRADLLRIVEEIDARVQEVFARAYAAAMDAEVVSMTGYLRGNLTDDDAIPELLATAEESMVYIDTEGRLVQVLAWRFKAWRPATRW